MLLLCKEKGAKKIISFLVLFIFFSLGFSIMANEIEEPKFRIIKKEGNFEIRKYQSYIQIYILVNSSFSEAGSLAFRPLISYINGQNKFAKDIKKNNFMIQKDTSISIPMTAPVTQTQWNNSYKVAFIMPAGSTLSTLPKPLNPNLKIEEVKEKTVAVIKYSGIWSADNYQYQLKTLKKWMQKKSFFPLEKLYGQDITPHGLYGLCVAMKL